MLNKKYAAKFIKSIFTLCIFNKKERINNFSWQNGYGTFSVSSSKVEVVKNYIVNQREHHKRTSFKEEYRTFLNEYKIDYDERYVWD